MAIATFDERNAELATRVVEPLERRERLSMQTRGNAITTVDY